MQSNYQPEILDFIDVISTEKIPGSNMYPFPNERSSPYKAICVDEFGAGFQKFIKLNWKQENPSYRFLEFDCLPILNGECASEPLSIHNPSHSLIKFPTIDLVSFQLKHLYLNGEITYRIPWFVIDVASSQSNQEDIETFDNYILQCSCCKSGTAHSLNSCQDYSNQLLFFNEFLREKNYEMIFQGVNQQNLVFNSREGNVMMTKFDQVLLCENLLTLLLL